MSLNWTKKVTKEERYLRKNRNKFHYGKVFKDEMSGQALQGKLIIEKSIERKNVHRRKPRLEYINQTTECDSY